MATGTRPSRIRISYTIREEDESKHRSGINSLAFDTETSKLFTAGRDGFIRCWDASSLKERTASSSLEVDSLEGLPLLAPFDAHSDWVNDVVLCSDGLVASASSDATVKLWTMDGKLLSTLGKHTDYVKALASAIDTKFLYSAGLDRKIYSWDLATERVVDVNATAIAYEGHKASIYSIASNKAGSILISGSTEKFLRAWDVKSNRKMFKLRGHTENVKSIVVNAEGTLCISGSSDGTVRLWDLGQQRCVSVISCHKDSVWSVLANESFSQVYSASRNGCVYVTDISTLSSQLVFKEAHPVTKICFSHCDDYIWSATTDSTVHCWSTKNKPKEEDVEPKASSDAICLIDSPSNNKPVHVIPGASSIVKYHVLNNKRDVLTLDSDGNVSLYDLMRAQKTKTFGKVDFEKTITDLFTMHSVLAWFTLDIKLGLLTVHLDANQSFMSESYAIDTGFDLANDEIKINLGSLVVRGLFARWLVAYEARNNPNAQRRDSESEGNHDKSPSSSEGNDSENTRPPTPPFSATAPHENESCSTELKSQDEQTLALSTTEFAADKEVPSSSGPATPQLQSLESTSEKGILNKAMGKLRKLSPSASDSDTGKRSNGKEPSPQATESALPELHLMLGIPPQTIVSLTDIAQGSVGSQIWRISCKDMSSSWAINAIYSSMPSWIAECVIKDSIYVKEAPKISFILSPHPKQVGTPLGPLPDGPQCKLNAYRILRAKRMCTYIAQKLNLNLPADTIAADVIEITVHDKPVNPNWSMAAIKQYVWNSPEEMLLHYRRKVSL